jgi:hypothetical protein
MQKANGRVYVRQNNRKGYTVVVYGLNVRQLSVNKEYRTEHKNASLLLQVYSRPTSASTRIRYIPHPLFRCQAETGIGQSPYSGY